MGSEMCIRDSLNTEANQFSTSHPDGTQNNPASSQAATVGHIKTGSARSFDFLQKFLDHGLMHLAQTELTKLYQVEMVLLIGILVVVIEPLVTGI